MKELEVYKLLPKKNCKRCPPGTCISFALQLKKDLSLLEECPYIDNDKREYLKRNLEVYDWRDDLIERLKKEVSSLDLSKISEGIGAIKVEGGISLRCIGKDYIITPDGTITPDTENKWIKILLLHYIRTAGQGGFSGEWSSFSDFRGGSVKSSTFQRDCEIPLKQFFDQKPDETIRLLQRLGARRVEGYSAEIALIIDLLPKVRILILYSRGDEELPSSLRILFDKVTERFLDVESMIFLVEGLIHTLNYHLFR